MTDPDPLRIYKKINSPTSNRTRMAMHNVRCEMLCLGRLAIDNISRAAIGAPIDAIGGPRGGTGA